MWLQFATMIKKIQLILFLVFNLVVLSVLSQNCDKFSSSHYICNAKKAQESCRSYAILRANSHFSSLSNLSSYLSIAPSDLAEANAFSNDVELLSKDQPVLIPIECKCSNGGFYEAQVRKITTKGDSFYEIAESLKGLTSCKAIQDRNPGFSPSNLDERIHVVVPLQCACPSSSDSWKILASYPVKKGDKLDRLAVEFNVSEQTLVAANQMYSRSGLFKLSPFSTTLIPLQENPALGFFEKSQNFSSMGHGAGSIRVKRRKKAKKWMIGVYIAIGIVGFVAFIAIGISFFLIHCKKKKVKELSKNGADLELQQLSLSIRTTSDKKVSFEGSQCNFDDHSIYTTTPHKMRVESYSFEDLKRATEDFGLSCLIGGSVFHGRLKGKNLAIKRIASDMMCKLDSQMFQERILHHHHPNIIRLLGTCLMDGPDSFIVFEYAKNGSLKDWIHGGLAIKSHFIASCSCFLSWNQRLRICLDLATALQHMHHIMNPSYVHQNIKSRNVFLDEDFGAKIGNFGMSKLVDDSDESCLGYLAPECLAKGVSSSTDVFSYGVVLLEVLSGKPPTTQDEDGNYVKLCDEIKRVLGSEDVEELRGWIDGGLGENYSFDGAVMLANLARSCVDDDASVRPNAGEIVEKLLRLVDESPEMDQFNMCESSCKPLVMAGEREM